MCVPVSDSEILFGGLKENYALVLCGEAANKYLF